MSDSTTHSPGLAAPFDDRLSHFARWRLALLGSGLLGLLALAASLDPDPKGWGTHQQLGLPPCTSQLIFGIPCPACGMTTSWSWFGRGNLVRSWHANPGGTWLAMTALVTGIVSLGLALRGRDLPFGWFVRGNLIALVIGLLIATLQWIVQLAS